MAMDQLAEMLMADPQFTQVMQAAQQASQAHESAAGASLERIEEKLDRLLAFDALLVELLAPMFPKKVASVVVPQLRRVLE